MAAASVHVMELSKKEYQRYTEPSLSHINVGTGVDCTIRELVETIAKVVDYKGLIVWDTSKPDGTLRKLMDVSRLTSLGWQCKYSLSDGLMDTYRWFLENQNELRA